MLSRGLCIRETVVLFQRPDCRALEIHDLLRKIERNQMSRQDWQPEEIFSAGVQIQFRITLSTNHTAWETRQATNRGGGGVSPFSKQRWRQRTVRITARINHGGRTLHSDKIFANFKAAACNNQRKCPAQTL